MKTIDIKYIILLCLVILTNKRAYAQVHRLDVNALIGSIQVGTPPFDPIPFYYSTVHGYSAKEAALKSKEAKLADILLETSPQVDATETLDSVVTRRSVVYGLDEIDKSSVVGSFFAVEKDRLEKLLSQIEKNVEKIPGADYGGSASLQRDWNMRCKSIRCGIAIADNYRMTAINRKKIYVNLYNDALKYNEELNEVLGYLMSTKQLERMAKATPVKKVVKKDYITYGHSRWTAACQISKSQSKSN